MIALIDSNECSPLSTHTFTDQKPPKKLRWTFFTFFYGQTFVLSSCLDRSYRESTITVRCFYTMREATMSQPRLPI